MTFRTFDIDAGVVSGATSNDHASTDMTARNVRSRRHARVLGHRTMGSRVSGFGF